MFKHSFQVENFTVCLFKVTVCAIMFVTAALMLYDYLIWPEVLPSFFTLTSYDAVIWSIVLILMSFTQAALMLHFRCIKCRIVSDLVLQFSGFILIIIGWAFIDKYPPLTALMMLYPTIGFVAIIVGRFMGKTNRKLHKHYG